MQKLQNQISLEASKKNAISIIEKSKIKKNQNLKIIYLPKFFSWKETDPYIKSALLHLKHSHNYFFKYV